MSKQRRIFSLGEKWRIVEEAEAAGVKTVLLKYHLSYSVLSRWKQQFLSLESADKLRQLEDKINDLNAENSRLRNLLASYLLDKGKGKPFAGKGDHEDL